MTADDTRMTWEAWQEIVARLARPGWAVATFPLRTATGRTDFVPGAVLDRFGVYQAEGSYRQVKRETSALDITEGNPGNWLVHLPTSVHLGLFMEYDDAITAGAFASRIDEWQYSKEMGDQFFMAATARLSEYLYWCGIVLDDALSFLIRGETHPTFHRLPEVLNYGRPERVS